MGEKWAKSQFFHFFNLLFLEPRKAFLRSRISEIAIFPLFEDAVFIV